MGLQVRTVLQGKIGNIACFDISSLCKDTIPLQLLTWILRTPRTPSSLIFPMAEHLVIMKPGSRSKKINSYICCLVIGVYVLLHRNMRRLCPKLISFVQRESGWHSVFFPRLSPLVARVRDPARSTSGLGFQSYLIPWFFPYLGFFSYL